MSKGIQEWPFPKDRPVHKARKMALAYRNIAEEQAALLQQYQAAVEIIHRAIDEADKRLLAYRNPGTLGELEEALTVAKAALAATTAGNPVTDLDRRFTSWGETWHCEQPANYEMDDYVRTATAAKLVHMSSKTLTTMRNNGRINAIFNPNTGATGGYWYLVADVYALAASMPGRAWRSSRPADTLNANRTGDSK
jgi:protoporphyrinogen oxidase